MKWISPFLILCITVFFAPAQAANKKIEARFGPEWTFSIFTPGEEFSRFDYDLDEFSRKLRRLPGRRAYSLTIKEFLLSPQGWEVRLGTDPGVFEVQTSPMTVREFEKYQKTIQKDVFDNIKYLYGATPQLFVGGGHINIGIKEFINNPMLLHNFIVDFYNHNELSLGILGYDTNNALAFSMMPVRSREKILNSLKRYAKTISAKDFDRDDAENAMYELINDLCNLQDKLKDRFAAAWSAGEPTRDKLVDLNFYNADFVYGATYDSARLELRAVRPQVSADVYKRQIRLLQKRLNYLAQFDQPLTYKARFPLLRLTVRDHKLTPPVDPQDALQAFYTYVTEAGEKWSDHRDYIWPMWISSGELKKFEDSDWFISNERVKRSSVRKRSCEGILSP